ncbi:MAG: phenylalanine--tRNA ligase beta subunit-related protein, partial [Minisyncoccia bacterium]
MKFKESPEKLAEILTMHLAETKVKYINKRPVLEVDLLPNRISDCSGHFGLLREIAALLDKKFEYPKKELKQEINQGIKDWVEVKIQSPFCQRYEIGAIFGVKVKEAPLWLKNILKDCGLRPINNIVDAVNYVMLLTGQPLHVFDFQKVAFNKEKHPKKEIIIRQAKKGERILTLDNKLYQLKEHHLLITDKEKILALAGIKGGKLPEVDKNTKLILIESANFSPENIRQTSKELNLRTDA